MQNVALSRWRPSLLAAAAVITAIDFIGLGTRFADRTMPDGLTAPRAFGGSATPGALIVVPPLDPATEPIVGPRATQASGRSFDVRPAVLALDGIPGPAIVTPPPPAGPGDVPVAPVGQAAVAVPALDSHATVGAGDASCTGADLTVIAYGDCPQPAGDGPVVVQTGGSALPS